MDYQKHYQKLFQKASNRSNDFVGELHHFIPSTFTKNIRHKGKVKLLEDLLEINFDNSIKLLTYKEHFIAHLLLFKIFKCESSMFALSFVMNRLKFSKNYINFKKLVINTIKKQWKGKVAVYDKILNNNVIIDYEDYEIDKERYQGLNVKSDCNKKEFECEFCKKIILGYSNYSQHIKYYCDKNESRIQRQVIKIKCKFCGLKVVPIRIRDHERSCKLNPERTIRKNNFSEKICEFCGGTFLTLKNHDKTCKLNPNKIIKKKDYTNCQFCFETYIKRGIKIHEKNCYENTNRIVNKVICDFCKKEFESLHSHEPYCKLNPNKIIKKVINKKIKCKFCQKEIGLNNISEHERSCKLNPKRTIRKNNKKNKGIL